MLKTGLSTAGKIIDEQLFLAYREAGISEMEISVDKEKCDGFDFKTARRLADAYDIELWSFHLPFMPFEMIDISKPELAGKTVFYLSEIIGRAADTGISHVIIHPSGEPIQDEERPERMKYAQESLSCLSARAKNCGTILCVEDLPRTCLGRNSEEINRLVSVDESIKVCFDTNHLLSEAIPSFIKNVGDRIVTTHVSDYDFKDEKHWLPGDGDIDWRELCAALAEINYGGPWLYEVSFHPGTPSGKKRNLTCRDFAANAIEYCSL